MKKSLLLLLFLFSISSQAQVAKKYPKGFRKAEIPGWLKNRNDAKANSEKHIPYSIESIPNVNTRIAQPVGLEYEVGCTLYDLQTNGSVYNQLVVNTDGTIAAAWTTSPDNITSTNPPYQNRGSGYNYFNGINWINMGCPTIREEQLRTGFTNIVSTSSGIEMLIAHGSVGGAGSYSRISIARRTTKGSGTWNMLYPFGNTDYDAYPRAVSVGDTVYTIFLGSENGSIVAGQAGPIYFSRSLDGGLNWDPKSIISLIDSDFYNGFSADSYSLDAHDSIVAIGFGNKFTDVGLLKSTDYGQTWTKTIIQRNPFLLYSLTQSTDTNNDGVADTVYTSAGDVKVLIDNNGMVHAWFSEIRNCFDTAFFANLISDGVEYWNESMPTDGYVEIAATQDFNGNGILDIPVDTNTTCTNTLPWGHFNGGLSIMPSAGINSSGRIYLTYSAIDEIADTSVHMLHRHVYMMTLDPPYNTANWTFPYDIIPSINDGGNGEHEEGAFACVARHVDNSYVHVLYQRDLYAGTSLSTTNTCEEVFNSGSLGSEIYVTKVDATTVGIKAATQNNLFVSQNFPNPATGMTYIQVGLKNSCDVTLEVYDVVGEKIFTEIRKDVDPGSIAFSFNASVLNPGIYLYAVNAEEEMIVKMMVVK